MGAACVIFPTISNLPGNQANSSSTAERNAFETKWNAEILTAESAFHPPME
jgi:hypothetical protein